MNQSEEPVERFYQVKVFFSQTDYRYRSKWLRLKEGQGVREILGAVFPHGFNGQKVKRIEVKILKERPLGEAGEKVEKLVDKPIAR